MLFAVPFGQAFQHYADRNLVRAYVRELRVKLGDDARNPDWIFNERGVGYRMARPGDPR